MSAKAYKYVQIHSSNINLICLMSRWKPTLRMTPEAAMHHAWMQDPWLNKMKKPKTATKQSEGSFFTPEKKKETVHKNAQSEKRGLLALTLA